jgi:hypothetical protein
VLSQFFQWLEVLYTLRYKIQITKRQERLVAKQPKVSDDEMMEQALMTNEGTFNDFSDIRSATDKNNRDTGGSSASYLSYDTEYIQEERTDNSKKAKTLLLVAVALNVALNVWCLNAYVKASDLGDVPWNDVSFGFADAKETFQTVPLFLIALYSLMIFIYLPMLVKIMQMFKIAYP